MIVHKRPIRLLLGITTFIVMAGLLLSQGSQNPVLNDPIAALGRQIERGEVQLEYSSNGWGYLPSLLEYLDLKKEAAAIEAAVQDSVVTGNGTAEIGGGLGTRETGDYIVNTIRRSKH